MNGMSVVKMADPNVSMNPPLMKEVAVTSGGWLANYFAHPVLWVFPCFGVCRLCFELWFAKQTPHLTGFAVMSLAVLGMIMTAGVALFPFVLPSSENPAMSLTLWDVASSKYAECDAVGGDYFRADHSHVHLVGVSRHARQGHGRVCEGQ